MRLRLGWSVLRGVNRPPQRTASSRPQPHSYAEGLTDRNVGRTGTTRGYPVGRTG
jgi:hypothetical protein